MSYAKANSHPTSTVVRIARSLYPFWWCVAQPPLAIKISEGTWIFKKCLDKG
jgi:hypothetical protein